MEGFFRRNLSGVRLAEGPEARALNRELSSEGFATGQDVFMGSPRPAARETPERLALLGHELSHVVDAGTQPAPVAAGRPVVVRESERRARRSEREIYALARAQQGPLVQKSPKLPMEMAAIRPPEEAAPVQKRVGGRFADTAIQRIERTGERVASIAELLFPRPPRHDLTPLVHHVYQKIKKELAILRERTVGGF
jgi:hypothetical protein